MSETVAIIPARGGSKGVTGKNLRRVGGLPLIARAVSAAACADGVHRVIVTTDDDAIASVAAEWGAEVIRRPAQLADDTASSESALLHALDELEAQGVDVGIVAFLQATSPFIDPAALSRAVQQVRSRRRDSVFSAVETHAFVWRKSAENGVHAQNHDASVRPRRQDRDPDYIESGAFYVVRAAGFRALRHRFFGSVGLVEVPALTAIEIDTESDLAVARALAPLIDRSSPIDVDAVVTDFDGVHTADTATVDQDGRESVVVSRSDGYGVARLREAGVPMMILSAERNPVVTARAQKLQVDVRQGVDDKVDALRQWAKAQGVPLKRIAYLGNDLPDLGCLQIVGWPVAVADAHPEVVAAARVVLDVHGGAGAVRELAERVLDARVAASVPLEVPRQEKA